MRQARLRAAPREDRVTPRPRHHLAAGGIAAHLRGRLGSTTAYTGGYMAAMNTGRVIVGGLVAGVLINIVEFVMNGLVLAGAMRDFYAKMGVPEPGGAALAWYVVLGFVLGILIAWTYAAIRPRFGAGPKTAFCAAVAVWVAGALVPIIGWMLMGMYAVWLGVIGLIYVFVEFLLAALVAGALYKEGTPASL
jgi:hypothetical protein